MKRPGLLERAERALRRNRRDWLGNVLPFLAWKSGYVAGYKAAKRERAK
jgi:hypothetical protein